MLLNEYGKFNSFHVEYGYQMFENLTITPAVLDIGIISTHIEDMDLDGIPELMVFSTKPAQYERTNIDLHVYHMEDGEIKYLGEGRLCSGIFRGSEYALRIFIKDFGDRKVIGASSKDVVSYIGDGEGYEINLYQVSKDRGMERVFTKEGGSSDWFEYVGEWADEIRLQGFEVSASEWLQTDEPFISMNEPGCYFLITGQTTDNINNSQEFSNLVSSMWGRVEVNEALSPYKITGDIIVHN